MASTGANITGSIWDQVLARIETKVNQHIYSTWFKPTTFVADDGHLLRIRVPNALFSNWLNKHYSVVLDEALTEVHRQGCVVSFVTEEASAADRTAVVASGPATAATTEDIVPGPPGSLAPRYSFDAFIVGPSNQFAHAACRAVAEAPSRSYNPLFIYGGVGLGKTHLMHAIGHYVLTHLASLKLTYISSERFMNEMINAVRYDRILDFRERYRSVDVLLVDDIQFIAGKEGTQNEFFHTFNALYDSQKQIVISSDCPPHEIPSLEERLRSRFEWGLIADIQAPDLETKVAILKKKAETEGIPLPDNVAIYIAGKIKSNIRELEGSLDPAHRIRVADRPRDLAGARTGRAPQHPSARRPSGDDRDHPEVRRRLLPVEARGTEVAQQLEISRAAAPGGDVSVQSADERVAPRDRPELRRQAPFDGDSLHQKNRSGPTARRRFQQPHQQPDGVFSLALARLFEVFHRSASGMPADVLWTAHRPGRPGCKPAQKPASLPSASPQPKSLN